MIRTIAAALAAFALLSFGVRAEETKPAEAAKAEAKPEKAEKKAHKKAHKKAKKGAEEKPAEAAPAK